MCLRICAGIADRTPKGCDSFRTNSAARTPEYHSKEQHLRIGELRRLRMSQVSRMYADALANPINKLAYVLRVFAFEIGTCCVTLFIAPQVLRKPFGKEWKKDALG